MTRAELLPEILKLSVDDQILIADALRHSIRGQPADSAEFLGELAAIREDFIKNPQLSLSWKNLSRELDTL